MFANNKTLPIKSLLKGFLAETLNGVPGQERLKTPDAAY